MTPAAHPRPRPAGAAFTLTEVLVTLVLIGVILPVTARGLSLAMSVASDAGHRSVAAGLAQARLNELAVDGASTAGASGDFGPEHRGYRWTMRGQPVSEGLEEVTVQVEWTSRGRAQSLSLSTWVRRETGGLIE